MFGLSAGGTKKRSRRLTVIIDGLSLTVIGMAIVFSFLIILVLAMKFLNFILRKFFPKSFEHKTDTRKSGEHSGAKKDDLAVVAAAVAAINAHIAVSRG